MTTVLVTGGAGYIGSHTVIELVEHGYNPVVVDNLANSSIDAIERVRALTSHPVPFAEGDVADREFLTAVVGEHDVAAAIHFAGLKAVGESVEDPIRYYDVNLGTTLSLLTVLQASGCRQLVFSSSATVYSPEATSPIDEDSPLGPTNPYGRTKLMIEDILRDLAASDDSWGIALLRYFNPVYPDPFESGGGKCNNYYLE